MATYKYSNWSFGQIEALLNIIGEENAKNLLAGKAKMTIDKVVDSILTFISLVTVAATQKFVAKDFFGSKKFYLGDIFKSWFLGKIEEPQAEMELRRHTLSCRSRDLPIIAELDGEEKAETTLSQIAALIEKQSKGEEGVLLVNGYANVFYVRDVDGVLRTVNVDWCGDRWHLGANPLEDQAGWRGGYQVFSRNS